MKIYLQTQRLKLMTSNIFMAREILNFHKENKDFFDPWESKKSSNYYTLETTLNIIANEKKYFKRGTDITLWIFHKENGDLIGKISIFGIIMGNFSSGYMGYKLALKYNNNGYMTEALKRVVSFLFEDLNFHRLDIAIIPRNNRSINLVEKLGFVNEGINKKLIEVNGVWEDHYRYAKINEKWEKL